MLRWVAHEAVLRAFRRHAGRGGQAPAGGPLAQGRARPVPHGGNEAWVNLDAVEDWAAGAVPAHLHGKRSLQDR